MVFSLAKVEIVLSIFSTPIRALQACLTINSIAWVTGCRQRGGWVELLFLGWEKEIRLLGERTVPSGKATLDSNWNMLLLSKHYKCTFNTFGEFKDKWYRDVKRRQGASFSKLGARFWKARLRTNSLNFSFPLGMYLSSESRKICSWLDFVCYILAMHTTFSPDSILLTDVHNYLCNCLVNGHVPQSTSSSTGPKMVTSLLISIFPELAQNLENRTLVNKYFSNVVEWSSCPNFKIRTKVGSNYLLDFLPPLCLLSQIFP